jgi:hypothetical protein
VGELPKLQPESTSSSMEANTIGPNKDFFIGIYLAQGEDEWWKLLSL